MTELETIKRAKMYIDKLANGINPIDNTMVPEEDVINNVRVSRCFFFVSDILRQVIENGGIAPASRANKPQKIPFSLSYEQRDRFAFSDSPITASEIARRINALANNESMKKMSYKVIATWLVEIGMLSLVTLPSGTNTKRPTAEGNRVGITVEEREGTNGPYQVVVYNTQAQQFILDNLDAITEAERGTGGISGK